MPAPEPPTPPGHDPIPPALRAALGRAFPAPAAGDLDARVLAEARRRLGRRSVLARVGLPLSAAAAVALAALGLWRWNHAAPSTLAAGPADAVTILDAFTLARLLRDGQRPGPAWDANLDGVVDARDVDALARRAVRLSALPTPTPSGSGGGGA